MTADDCGYCGDARAQHDRLTDEWRRCQEKAEWFAQQASAVAA